MINRVARLCSARGVNSSFGVIGAFAVVAKLNSVIATVTITHVALI